MSVTTEAKKRIRESETSRAIPSFAYIEGRWDSVSPEDVRQCMKIKPDDWKLAYHERADHRYRIAIQTIARHEERYIKEWIKHHLEIGVDHNAKDVDVYFDADDEDHGLFSWIMNHWRWF